ncbi:MAG: hypothetical protein WCO67_17460, partial [Betaproteobacteria bacterium]
MSTSIVRWGLDEHRQPCASNEDRQVAVLGGPLRQAGKFLNAWRFRDSGVHALVDGEVDLQLSPLSFPGGAYSFDPRLTR